jgi:hypothetical protein
MSFCVSYLILQEEFKDIKGVIRSRKSKKYRQHNGQTKNDKDKLFYKTLHRKPNIE